VREAVEQHRGTSIVAHAPVYLRTAQLNDERRVDDEGSVTSEPKRRSKSPARLEDTLEAIVENEDRAWARVDDDEKRKSPRKSRRRYRFWPSSSSKKDDNGEARGLCNLGNTCYMNATLQALAAAPPLRTYFASGEYAFDLNTESKYSPKGVLAAAFGDLVSALQEKKGGAFRPNRFRRVVGRYDATFAGYRQQDAFEFLAKLVEGLGDDLSGRGSESKPYYENPQLVNSQCDIDAVISGDEPSLRQAASVEETEALIAAKCLEHERLRHDHFVSYSLLGQTRYQLECEKTNESLVCYEQWTALTVNLPHGQPRLDVFCRVSFAANRAWPIDVRVELQQKQHAVIGDVLDALAHLEDLAENKLERSRLVACRIDDDDPALIEAILDDGDALDQALRRGAPGVRLVVYEVADVDDAIPARCSRAASPATSEDLTARGSSEDLEASIDPDQRCVVRVSLRALVDMNEDDGLYFLSSATPELLGAPFAVRLSRRASSCKLYEAVWSHIKRYLADVPDEVEGRRRYPFLLRRCLSTDEDPVVPPRRDRRCGEIITEEDDASVEIPFPELRDGELFVADLADAARDRFAKGDRVVSYARSHASMEGEDATSALRDDADRGDNSSLKDCFRVALGAQDVQRRSSKTERDETWRGSRTLCSLPPVLVVHLKRFGETGGGRRVKRTARVDFPLDDLDLGAFSGSHLQDEESCVYDLVATVDHLGGLNGGHYTAACRVTREGMCARGDAWLRCDDRCVAPLDADKVVAPSAYVLVYLRRGASQNLIREALPRREEDSVDVSALLAGVTKSRRSRSTSARPVKPEEPSTEDVKPITLKRRLLNTMGFTKTPRERSSSEDSSTKPVEAEPAEGVVVSDAVEAVVGDEPPPLTSLEA
jgi:ubiquitin C-terminal hydrolase